MSLHHSLLDLHKLLLDVQRHEYERMFGPVGNPGQLLEMVTNSPMFAWLRSLSGLIVALEEASEGDQSAEKLRSALVEVKTLLTPSETGSEFARKYHAALQGHADIAVAHGKVMEELKTLLS